MKAAKRRYTMTSRAAKAQETRERIRESAIGIYRDNGIEGFTLDAVAHRARTTVQTILRAFGSKEELVLAALEAMADTAATIKPTKPGDVAAAVHATYDLYETIGDLLIARLGEEHRYPSLKPLLELGRAGHREWVETAFAPYVENRPDVFEMLNVLTDLYVWKLLRRDRRLSRAAAERLVVYMITSIVKEHTNGKTALAQLVGRR